MINELRNCLVSDDYDTLLMAVAFAKTGPLLRLKAEIEQWLANRKQIFSIFGINHRNTSRQALEFALEKFTKARVLFHSDDFTYHPKMYLFVGSKKCRFFIGSHNLTVGGTETNWESGTEVNVTLPEDKGMLAEALTAWDSIWALSMELNKPLIQEYSIFGKLSDENEPRRRVAASQPAVGSAARKQTGPPSLKLKIKPPSPLPKSLFVARKLVTVPKDVAQKSMVSEVSAEALVIQIVPHHNGEVFLSKIAINQNPDFFGYPFSGQTTPKKAGNPQYPQRVPDPIVDFKVYGNGATVVVHLPRLALNTVFYTTRTEIRITVPPEIVRNTPPL